MALQCVKCGSKNVRRSQQRRLIDIFLLPLRLHAYRCRSCYRRSYLLGKPEARDRDHAGLATPA
jgi:hypothetical protein